MDNMNSYGMSTDTSMDGQEMARVLYYNFLHECAVLRARERAYTRAARRRRAIRRLQAEQSARRQRCRARRQRALQLIEDRRRVWRAEFIRRHRQLYPQQ